MTATSNTSPGCSFCSSWVPHRPEQCPAVKTIKYHQNGMVSEIEKRDTPSPTPEWAGEVETK